MTTAAAQPSEPETRLWAPEAMARIFRNAVLRALVGALLVAGLVMFAREHGWMQQVELLVYDKARVAWSHPEANQRVMLIGMTEADIQRWHYPFSDEVLAQLLERLAAWQPRVIGVDIYRDMPVPPGTDRLTALLQSHPEIIWVFKLAEGDDKHPEIPPPKPLIGTDQAALADIPTDSGGVARRGLLYADDGKQNYAGLGMALALGYLARQRIQPEAAADDSIRLGKAVLPPLDNDRGPYLHLDSRGYQVMLEYYGGAQPFPRKSVADIMDRDMSALVRDRVVIIGDTLESVKDTFATPFSTGFSHHEPDYGIEIHAHLADQLIRQAVDGAAMLTGLPRLYENAWILGWALAGAALGLAIRGTVAASLGSAVGVTVIGVVVYAAFGRALLLPAIPAALAWLGAAGLTNQVVHAADNRARVRLRKSFEHYLPPAVIERMVKSDMLPTLGGERREITVLFTDVAGFTTFSETIEPEALAAISNEYFQGVCSAVFAQGGLVNAFIGDSVLAFFGAPLPQADHVDRALAAALAIDRFTSGFSAAQLARGVEFGHTRIGVHTGEAFLGNIGSRERLQYTALGDMLNTGSRLEALNKTIGTHLCCSGDIARETTQFRCRPVGSFVVKGRHEPTEVYAPLDPANPRPEWEARYEAAFAAAKAREPDALDLFAAMHEEDPTDPCVAFHFHRLSRGEIGTTIVMEGK